MRPSGSPHRTGSPSDCSHVLAEEGRHGFEILRKRYAAED
jgi:hypothetical protein